MSTLIILPLCFVAWLIARAALSDAKLRNFVSNQKATNYWQIDGLRFFLAYSVFMHHLFIQKDYALTGTWRLPDNPLYTFLGQAGVSLFFIITGFLFWDKALKQPDHFDAIRFYRGRLRRLAPAYLTAAIPFILISLVQVGWPIGWSDFRQFFQTLALGLFGSINFGNLNLSPALTGVFWTLFYEWKFYFFLPMLYLFLGFKKHYIFTSLICVAILLLSVVSGMGISKDWPFISLFASGILAANIYNQREFQEYRPNQFFVATVIAAFVLLCFTLNIGNYYGSNSPIFFIIIFLAILKIEQSSFLGKVLRDPATLLLGSASYSIYVIHGFILTGISQLLTQGKSGFTDPEFLLFCLLSAIAVSVISLFIFKNIELPFAFKKIKHTALTP